jgi:hypothetical protein
LCEEQFIKEIILLWRVIGPIIVEISNVARDAMVAATGLRPLVGAQSSLYPKCVQRQLSSCELCKRPQMKSLKKRN